VGGTSGGVDVTVSLETRLRDICKTCFRKITREGVSVLLDKFFRINDMYEERKKLKGEGRKC